MINGDIDLRPGDICRHGANAFPRYRVIHVSEGKVWLRDIDSGADAIVDASACGKVSHEPAPDQHPAPPEEGDSLESPPPGPGIR